MTDPVRLRADALLELIRSDELRDALSPKSQGDPETNWGTRYAVAMEFLTMAADNAGRVFESSDEAWFFITGDADGGFFVPTPLTSKVLSLLEPVVPQAPRHRYAETTPEEDWESAVATAVFAATASNLIPRQRAGLVDGCLWLLTERTPSKKYQTKYRSAGAVGVKETRLLAHEHVVQRKGLITRILASGSPAEIREILKEAVGCTILRTEHPALSANKGLDGWERYRAAGIEVYDCGSNGNEKPRVVPWSELGLTED